MQLSLEKLAVKGRERMNSKHILFVADVGVVAMRVSSDVVV
jgi:hypothetical protein